MKTSHTDQKNLIAPVLLFAFAASDDGIPELDIYQSKRKDTDKHSHRSAQEVWRSNRAKQ